MFLKLLISILAVNIPVRQCGFLLESNTNLIQKQFNDWPSVAQVHDGNNPKQCSQRVQEYRSQYDEITGTRNRTFGVKPTVSLGSAIGIFVLVGVVAAAIAQGFQMVRRYIYHDADNLDTAFDAGGKVSIGLTATTIVSQWTWSATLLQSSTVAAEFGISGPYFYAGGACIQIIIFSVLSIMLKTKAPGAKTFLQVIKARFGKRTHIVFCVFAFLTNIIIMCSLTVAGTAVLNALVKDLSVELAAMIIAAVIGGYTLIGGLGATFYVSYFNTAFIFILILMLVVEVFYNPYENPDNPFGGSYQLYEFITCWEAPEGNRDYNYMTFYSTGGLVFGIVNIVGNFGTVFCDQAYWQSSVAAKPLQGVWGFIAGGLVWFSIPFTLATTMGLSYVGLSSAQNASLLSESDVSAGLTAPVVAQSLLGPLGEYSMLFLILMAVMSTGSAEIIAVASLIIYDVYQAYIQPFRKDLKPGHCILCANPMRMENITVNPSYTEGKESIESKMELCNCPSAKSCEACKEDSKLRSKATGLIKPQYTCSIHGEFKQYQEVLLNYKNWCIVICTLLSVPLCLFCYAVGLDLGYTYYFTGILIASSVVPISMSILWARATSIGMIAGVVGGCASGLIAWLIYSSTYDGGLSNFVENTGEDYPMLAGNLTSLIVGAIMVITVSMFTRRSMSKLEVEEEWEKTREIDNPLSPWVQIYKGELNIDEGDCFYEKPPLELVIQKFKTAKITAYIATLVFVLLFLGIIPGSMLSIPILDADDFNIWTNISRAWAYVASAFIIIVPLVQEMHAIIQQHKSNKAFKHMNDDDEIQTDHTNTSQDE